MNKLIFPVLLITFNSLGQEKDLEINKHLWGRNRGIVESFIDSGHKDFVFVDREHFGLVFSGNYDSCNDPTFVQFIMAKAKTPGKYDLTKYDKCKQTLVTTHSGALRFFEENRNQIRADSIEERVLIDHTVFYALYEFKDGKLRTYKHFCKECVDWDKEKLIKERNQNLKLYKFFEELDKELSKLANDD